MTGCGPLFQSLLIALQSAIPHTDIGTATTAFAFLRTVGAALALCIGLVVFQNSMQRQSTSPSLRGALSPDVIEAISGRNAASNVEFIQTLGVEERSVARAAYAKGLSDMWYFFLAVAVCCMLASFGIGEE